MSEVRRALAGLVREAPGCTIRELAERAGRSHSTVSYHLRILERGGEVEHRRDGRAVRWFAPGEAADLAKRMVPLLARARTVAILRLVRDRPDVRPFHIARELEVSVPTVMWHLEKLREVGALQLEKRKGHYDILLAPEVRGLIAGDANGHGRGDGGNASSTGP